MPGWHEKLKDTGIQQIGIIQEQHPDRCRLFMQWKQMDWPILVDSLNLLRVEKVPYTILVDGDGMIRYVKPKDADLETFLKTDYKDDSLAESADRKAPDAEQLDKRLGTLRKQKLEGQMGLEEHLALADQLVLWGGEERLDAAIEMYSVVLDANAGVSRAWFRRGVAYRKRFDSERRRETDFASAVSDWEKALELNPNQYIWRRRIQQYGPRLDKPYSFYDWINEARKDITARGEKPAKLAVEPSGAEFAYPEKEFKEGEAETKPDPEGKINRDGDKLISIDSVPVPGRIKAGEASRVHLTFSANAKLKAHWNNESGDSVAWVDVPDGWSVEKHLFTLPAGEGATDTIERNIEFEVRAPKDAKAGKVKLTGYALYYVCEDADGTCLYLRQDFEVTLEVRS
ncbi:MAG: hypothetical protein H6839_14345 [Planctomycetes bacterium]|nr:hypothetical protein [Planctomycetota bacterium]